MDNPIRSNDVLLYDLGIILHEDIVTIDIHFDFIWILVGSSSRVLEVTLFENVNTRPKKTGRRDILFHKYVVGKKVC